MWLKGIVYITLIQQNEKVEEMNLQVFNPISKEFLKFDSATRKQQDEVQRNSIGEGENDKPAIGDLDLNQDFAFTTHASQISFSQFFESKKARVGKYREMASYPEIAIALDNVVDEAVNKNSKGDSFSFNLNQTLDLKKREIRELHKSFNHVVNNVLGFNETGWELFWKFCVDGELYLEVVLNDKKDTIIGLKPLATWNMTPIFEDGVIIKFAQALDDKTVFFEKNQIIYINFGKFGENKQDVRSYLDPSIKIYNQLRTLEDAVVIYRLVRAPERRVWNVEVGNAPTGKAEEIVKQTMHRYKKNLNLDTETGLIDSSQKFQALTEDFWFARRDGAGSTVDTIQGGQQLGELEDVNYFLKKLYKSLKIPRSRWQEDGGKQYTNTKDIEQDDLNFIKFVERIQTRFCGVLYQLFILQLQVSGADKKLFNPDRYDIKMEMSNHFRQYRDLELITQKLDLINTYQELILAKDNPNGILAQEFFMRYIVNLPGNLNSINKELLDVQREQIEDEGGFEEPDEDF